ALPISSKGPISIFFSMKIRKEQMEENPMVEWEYLQDKGLIDEWSKLNVLDETQAFSQSGAVIFAGPSDFAQVPLFGQHLYWIRVINRDAKWNRDETDYLLPYVRGVYINTVGILQQESIPLEYLDTASGEIKPEYILSGSPVLSEEIWVDEARSLTEQEKKELRDDKYILVREVADEWGNTREFWVRWIPVEDFYSSGPQDRHYCIERLAGIINFGDGRNGKIPSLIAGLNTIQARYKKGGGSRGNLEALEIKQLSKSMAYIDEVFNPEPSTRGCDRETHTQMVKRGPQLIKHQNRAVTASDFESLARQASLDIVQVKCLPKLKAQGMKTSSAITLVVLPRGGVNSGGDFPVLRQEVEKYLKDRTPSVLNRPGSIKIIEPVYLEISVYAVVVIDELDAMARVDKEARQRLDEFLAGSSGELSGKSWSIGEFPHISIFYTLLKSVSAVNYVEKVSMTVYKIDDSRRQEIDANKLAEFPHGMVVNGKHRIIVKNR
ncbi:MAG: baseplate J/gp47 family protein, partial [Syntrophomonadaceae bacterium]|nr:baseplate J/gp47 family protein [Syntrophomonadaceae bacterium]